MRLVLLESGWELNVTQDDKYQFVIGIASGEMKFNEILIWIKSNTIRISNIRLNQSTLLTFISDFSKGLKGEDI